MPKQDELTPNNWLVDVSDITLMGPVLKWNRAIKSGDVDAVIDIAVARIKAWPFGPDPRQKDSYEAITPQQWNEMLTEVGKAIGGVFQEAGK